MTNKASQAGLNGGRKPEPGRKLIVISGGFDGRHEPKSQAMAIVPIVSQLRLARIKERQSKIAYELEELSKEWQLVRSDLLKGAKIEEGPIRAWLERRFIVSKGKKQKTRTRLRVY